MLRKPVTGLVVVTLVLATPIWARSQEPGAGRAGSTRIRSSSPLLQMQNALELAVQSGASDLLGQMSRVTRVPPFAQLNGQPQAHGFELPGWGMFFYVRVPGMSATVLSALAILAVPEDRAPRPPSGVVPAVPVGIPGEAAAPPVSPVDPPARVQSADFDVLENPDPHYVEAVRLALIDSMLEDSRALRLQPSDRLTIAVRKEGGISALDPSAEVRTMYFQVTGADLAAYHQDRIALEEARSRVIVTTAD